MHASAAEVKMHQHRVVATKTPSIQYDSGNKGFTLAESYNIKPFKTFNIYKIATI